MTGSRILSYGYTDQVEFRCGFLVAPRHFSPGPSQSNRPRAMATVGAGSRHAGGRAKMRRCVLSNGDWMKGAANAVAFIRTRHAAAAKDPITI
jgi:hypothetical protein